MSPIIVTLPAGTHHVCMCGKSKNAPYCDGSHDTGHDTDKHPKEVTLDKAGEVAICACDKTGNPPFCDGSHKQ